MYRDRQIQLEMVGIAVISNLYVIFIEGAVCKFVCIAS